ncbi:MAG: DedA family protein [Saprospiraceae bacterium]
MDTIFEILKKFYDFEWIFQHGGLPLLLFIVFAETGLFFGFFLPGDSLLFAAGMMVGLGIIPQSILVVILTVSLAGILGNYVGYWFGRKSGPLLYKKKDSFFFKQKHLSAAGDFYEKYGPSAIVLARFIPFIRTFAPIVAGIVSMDYKKFSFYNVIGCVAWVSSMILTGYFLGQRFPQLRDHLELVVMAIVVVTTVPVIWKVLMTKSKKMPPPPID